MKVSFELDVNDVLNSRYMRTLSMMARSFESTSVQKAWKEFTSQLETQVMTDLEDDSDEPC